MTSIFSQICFELFLSSSVLKVVPIRTNFAAHCIRYMFTPGLPGGPCDCLWGGLLEICLWYHAESFWVLSFPLTTKIMASYIVNYNFTNPAFKEIRACQNLFYQLCMMKTGFNIQLIKGWEKSLQNFIKTHEVHYVY